MGGWRLRLQPHSRPYGKGSISIAALFGRSPKIMEKAPSAGLFEGQTDEKDMGITYDEIDDYLLENKADDRVKEIIERAEKRTAHKRNNIIIYK